MSVDSTSGRNQGTNAPAARATDAISQLSVYTNISTISGVSFTASMVQLINGFPPSGRMFFFGSLFEPPRAGIKAIIFISPPHSSVPLCSRSDDRHLAKAHALGKQPYGAPWSVGV